MITSLPKQRRPTYHFLRFAKNFNPVHLSIAIDAENLLKHRECFKNGTKKKISYTAYMLYFASRALEKFPEVNVSIKHSFIPKMMRHQQIHGKFTLDKSAGDERVVLPGLVRDANCKTLVQIQEVIDEYKESKYEDSPHFRNARILAKLPMALGGFIYRKVLSNLVKRENAQGTFMVSSLGHNNIRNFFPIITSTVAFGVGAIEKTPVVKNDQIVIGHLLNLSMSFEHSAIDGALASDFLNYIKSSIEEFNISKLI